MASEMLDAGMSIVCAFATVGIVSKGIIDAGITFVIAFAGSSILFSGIIDDIIARIGHRKAPAA